MLLLLSEKGICQFFSLERNWLSSRLSKENYKFRTPLFPISSMLLEGYSNARVTTRNLGLGDILKRH